MKHLISASWLPFATLAAIAVAAPARADQAGVGTSAAQDKTDATAPDDATQGDIIVTASKRAQSLQDVSSSIAALDGADLREKGANSFADYLSTVPSLAMFDQGPGISTLVIRGITTGGARNDEPQNKETVGVYLDETPISVNGFNPDLGLYDLQRIEVLRGPQGTLYGSGSMGGTIRIITNKPDAGKIEGSFDGTVSATEHGGVNYDIKGMFNVPLIADRLALRTVAYRTALDGYIDNLSTGKNNENAARTTGGRVELGGQLTDAVKANLTYIVHDLRTDARSEQTAPYTRSVATFDGLSDHNDIANFTVNVDLGGPTLTSSTSYFSQKTLNRNTLEFVLDAALGFAGDTSPLVDTTKVREFSQEVRLASSGKGPFTWVIGGFYQHRLRSYSQNGPTPGLDAFVGVASTDLGTPDADNAYYSIQHIKQVQFAAFGEISYEFVPNLTATVGGRYFNYTEDFDTYASGLLNGGVTQSTGRLKEDGFTPKVNLSYKASARSMVYAAASKGFRLGGVNSAIPAGLCGPDLATLGTPADSFKSDTVWNYEVGTKNKFFGRRLTVNASVYRIDWSDIQTTLTLPTCLSSFRTNAGTARSVGVEFESNLVLGAFDLNVNAGYNNSELRQDVPLTPWKKGDHVPGVPRFQASGGVRYAFRLWPDAKAFARADVRYVGSIDRQFNAGDADNRRYGNYAIVDLRVGSAIPGLPLQLSVFASNLFDGSGRVAAQPDSVIFPENYNTIRPRTIGATLQATF